MAVTKKTKNEARVVVKKFLEKEQSNEDLLQGEYLLGQNNKVWCIDGTYINSGNTLLVVDLGSRAIIGDLYLHGNKSNEFSTEDVCQLVNECFKHRILQDEQMKVIVHSDRGAQFKGEKLKKAFEDNEQISLSMVVGSRGNQVIESINARYKDFLRLILDVKPNEAKAKSKKDTLMLMRELTEEQARMNHKTAINMYNNQSCVFNQKFPPLEYDLALTRQKNHDFAPVVIKSKNDASPEAALIKEYRQEVALKYAGDAIAFFVDWRTKGEKAEKEALQKLEILERASQFQIKQAALTNEQLVLKIEALDRRMQELLNEKDERKQQELRALEKRNKRRNAKKQPLRDAVSPEEFQVIFDSIKGSTLKTARLRVALTLLYLTGLRVSNLLQFNVANLQELRKKQSTLANIIKKGGTKKLVVPNNAKSWFKQIEIDTAILVEGKKYDDHLFTNQDGKAISRENFNKELNNVLKKASAKLEKRIYTHSFRVSMITELLQSMGIHEVKQVIGHRDIRTTEVYDRNFMGELELRKAMQYVYNSRKEKTNKTVKEKQEK